MLSQAASEGRRHCFVSSLNPFWRAASVPKGRRRISSSPNSFDESHQQHILLEHIHRKTPDNNQDMTISILTLDRPKANAMGHQMLQELADAIGSLESPTAASRCVILTSHSPRVFSAGADLKERSSMTIDEAEAFVSRLRSTFQRFSRLPVPTIASMEGAALGGGLELALACDLRVATKQTVLGLPECSLGIIPGAGGTQRLLRLVGMARAKQMILTAERVHGDKAYEYGLVQYLVEPGHCLDFSKELAWRLAGHGPVAIRAAKQALEDGMDSSSMEQALEVERRNYSKTLTTEDRLEGLAAFKEGRTPSYRGK